MAGAGAIQAGAAYVELSLKDGALLAGMAAAKKKLQAFGEGLQRAGEKLFKGALVAGAPLAAGAFVFSGFEYAMARTKAVVEGLEGAAMGPRKLQEAFVALEKEARRLGRETAFTATDAAQAMAMLAGEAFTSNQILSATAPIVNLAAAAQSDLKETALVASRAMREMGYDASQFGRAADIMARALTSGGILSLHEFADAMKHVGPTGRMMGMSFEQIVAGIQNLGKAGIAGEEAGTALRTILVRLSAPTPEAAASLQELNVQIADLRGNIRPLPDLIDDFNRATKGMGNVQMAQHFKNIFGLLRTSPAAALMAKGGDSLRKQEKSLMAIGTAADVAKKQLDTLFGAFKVLKSSVEDVAISLGAAVAPVLREWGDVIVAVLPSLTGLIDRSGEFVRSWAGWVAAAAAASGAVFVLGAAFKILSAAVHVAAFGLFALLLPLKLASSAFLALSAGLLALKLPVAALVIAAGAAAIAVGAIFARSGGFEVMGRSIRQAAAELGKVGDAARQAFGGVATALRLGDLPAAARVAFLGVKLAWLETWEAMPNVWEKVKGGFADVGVFLINQAVITGTKVWDAVAEGAKDALDGVADLWDMLWAKTKSGWEAVTDGIADMWDMLWAKIKNGWEEVVALMIKSVRRVSPITNLLPNMPTDSKVDANATRRQEANDRQATDSIEARRQARKEREAKDANDREAVDSIEDRRLRRKARKAAAEKAAAEAARPAASGPSEVEKARKSLTSAVNALEIRKYGGELGAWAQEQLKKFGVGGKGGKPPVDTTALPAQQKADVAGTFNAMAIFGLGAKNTAEKIAHNTKATADGVKALAQGMYDGDFQGRFA